jgi:hypothetical protein
MTLNLQALPSAASFQAAAAPSSAGTTHQAEYPPGLLCPFQGGTAATLIGPSDLLEVENPLLVVYCHRWVVGCVGAGGGGGGGGGGGQRSFK